MRIVVVSDTHGMHEALGVLEGDVLIHCGDLEYGFDDAPGEVERLDAWFALQRFERILCIGGNHDFELERLTRSGASPFENAEYLEDETIEVGGVRFHGSPWVPELDAWAYYGSEQRLADAWAAIPSDTDVLITHTPPYDVLDRNSSGERVGCRLLRDRIASLRPALHCFGHVHASGGSAEGDATRFVNASMVSGSYEVTRAPVVVDL